MLTQDDHANLLKLISSDRLSLRGNEAQVVALLQHKLQQALNPQPEDSNGDDDTGSPE